VIILGVILAVVGFLFHLSILMWIGIVLAVVGAVLLLIGAVGNRSIAGRRHWY
jgi:hypothetical protein